MLILLGVLALTVCLLFMTLGAKGSWSFILPFRGAKLVGMLLVACGEPDETLGIPQAQQQGQSDSKPSGEILFVSDHNISLWDGDIKQLTSGEHAASPSWAPVGDRFAYVRVGEAFSDVIIARRDGAPLLAVTEGHQPDLEEFSEEYVANASWAWDVEWSPAGEQLIYVSDKGQFDQYSRPLYLWYSETFDVGPYMLNASAEIGATQEMPAFSPDGDTVAFVVRNEREFGNRVSEIWLLDLNSATWESFVESPEGSYAPDWAPDAQNIVYVQRTGTSNDNCSQAASKAVEGEAAAPSTSAEVIVSYGGWSSTAANCSRQCVRRVQARSVSPGACDLPSWMSCSRTSSLVAASVIRR